MLFNCTWARACVIVPAFALDRRGGLIFASCEKSKGRNAVNAERVRLGTSVSVETKKGAMRACCTPLFHSPHFLVCGLRLVCEATTLFFPILSAPPLRAVVFSSVVQSGCFCRYARRTTPPPLSSSWKDCVCLFFFTRPYALFCPFFMVGVGHREGRAKIKYKSKKHKHQLSFSCRGKPLGGSCTHTHTHTDTHTRAHVE